jgi:hypothetical protein
VSTTVIASPAIATVAKEYATASAAADSERSLFPVIPFTLMLMAVRKNTFDASTISINQQNGY